MSPFDLKTIQIEGNEMAEKRENLDTLTAMFVLYTNLAISLSIFIALVVVILMDLGVPERKTPIQQRGIRLSELPSRAINSALTR
jgi:hypothetical protein